MSELIPPKPTRKCMMTVYADCLGCRICKSVLIERTALRELAELLSDYVASDEGGLLSAKHYPTTSPEYQVAVAAGKKHGYGAMMHVLSRAWHECGKEDGLEGSGFIVSTCESLAEKRIEKARNLLAQLPIKRKETK